MTGRNGEKGAESPQWGRTRRRRGELGRWSSERGLDEEKRQVYLEQEKDHPGGEAEKLQEVEIRADPMKKINK